MDWNEAIGKNWLKIFVCFILFIVLINGCAITQSNAEKIAKEMEKYYDSINSLSMTVQEKNEEGDIIREYKYIFKKPYNSKKIFENGNIDSIYEKDVIIYYKSYYKASNTLYEGKGQPRQKEDIDFAKELRATLKQREASTADGFLNNRPVHILTVFSKDRSNKWIIWLDKENFIRLKEEMYSKLIRGKQCPKEYCLVSSIERSNVKMNPVIADSEFEIQEGEIPSDVRHGGDMFEVKPGWEYETELDKIKDDCITSLLLQKLEDSQMKESISQLTWGSMKEKGALEEDISNFIAENANTCVDLVRSFLVNHGYEIIKEGYSEFSEPIVTKIYLPTAKPGTEIEVPGGISVTINYPLRFRTEKSITVVGAILGGLTFDEADIKSVMQEET